MDQANLVAWLKSGAPWNAPSEVIETHAAYVFLTKDRAYKLKKAVNLGYLDFSTVARRRDALHKELTLNARTAPRMYLRVLPVTLAQGSYALGGTGEPVDNILEMTRFPNDALLSKVAEQGRLDASLTEKLIRHVVAFHAKAEIASDADWPSMIKRIADENARDLRSQAPSTFDAPELNRYLLQRDQALARCAPNLARQSPAVRRCHGDMHLANAFLDGDEPTLFDCIEFDDFYALMPPLYDVAFLLMDLCARGLKPLANRALNAWLIAQDPGEWDAAFGALATLPLYLAIRAEVRAKTEGRKPDARERAQNYVRLAAAMIRPSDACVVAIGGLSGAGKSTLARALAPDIGSPLGAVHLRTDEIRKRLAGVALDARLPSQTYTREASAEVYATMERLAHAALRSRQTIFADAVFASEAERQSIERIAAASGADFTGIWLEAAPTLLEQRLEKRRGDASDADVAVLRKQLGYDTGAITWHRIDASAGAEATLKTARDLLRL